MPEPESASDVLRPDNLVFSDLHPRGSDRRTEILSGLQKKQKSIDSKPPCQNIIQHAQNGKYSNTTQKPWPNVAGTIVC